jgi:hypothetical protein
MKPYLALFRAGPTSLHPQAVQRLEAQNFDYALSWFGDTAPEAPGAAFVHMQKGAKWPGLKATLETHADLIAQYRYVWLPDDDLLCVPEDVSRMFLICEELGLELAQPALTPDSYFSHVITLQHSCFQLRFTNFVEIMAPVFSAAMLQRILPTLGGNISGYGLDNVWPRLSELGKVAIIDDTPVKHTRPVGGPNYKFNRDAALSPVQEDWMESARYFVEHPSHYQINYAGLLQDGQTVCLSQRHEDVERMLTELISSTTGMRMTTTQLVRYLANHLDYAHLDEQHRVRYPRELLRVVMDDALRGTGLQFHSQAGSRQAA